MSRLDFDTFLQQGYWQNSRAKSPDPRSYVLGQAMLYYITFAPTSGIRWPSANTAMLI